MGRIGRCWLGLAAVFVLAGAAWGQDRTVVVLPRHYGATPLSAQIYAQASYVVAQGQFLESAAVARQANAKAVALEIDNAVKAVDAYFKRRELNREWRAKEEPSYQDRMKKQAAMFDEQLRYRFQTLMKGDVTEHLNWLLRELSGPTLAEEYMVSGQPLADSHLDLKLAPRDAQQIWLTDGGSKASQLLFRAGSGKVLETNWPLALRDASCDAARADFEHARDQALQDVQKDKIATGQSQQHLMKAVDGLFVALEDAYPKDVRADPAMFLRYQVARRYLQSLLAQVHRMINTDDRTFFDQSMQFTGDSVVDLLRYMYRNGMLFSPPQPGGEELYKKLFMTMRTLYLNTVIEPPARASNK